MTATPFISTSAAFSALSTPPTFLKNSGTGKTNGGDDSGVWAKWVPPVIVKGRVYLATFSNKLNVYGLLAPAPPPAPVNLTALGGNGLAALSWTAANRTASYTVRRSLTSGGPYTALQSGITTTYYTDSTVSNGTTYYYVVSAVNAFGESPNSPKPPPRPMRLRMAM